MNMSSSSKTVTRLTRSSSSHRPNTEAPGKLRRKPNDSALVQDLSLMSVTGQDRSGKTEDDDSCDQSLHSLSTLRPSVDTGLSAVVRLMELGRCKNVVVVAGAGISTASGIPDFRTPGTGLYSNLEKYNIPCPESIFTIDYFTNDPLPFFSLAKSLYPGRHRPNYIHYFIRTLHHKGLLLRMYTQNIDGLEKLCGIPEDKLVEAHGSFATASCHLCYNPYPADEAKAAIMSDNIPTCSFCTATVKPDVVFFGEDLPQKFFLHSKDFPKTDLLLIMGTSLQIEPFASLVNMVCSTVPRLLLNQNAVGPFTKVPPRKRDYMELGNLEDVIRRFAQMLGWNQEIEELMRAQETLGSPEITSTSYSQHSEGQTRS